VEKNGMNMEYRCIEQKLSQIGAKIANATDLLHQAKELANSSESTLINAQKEIDALYVSLEDDNLPEASKN
jgi:NurA-like 5'-3' nuclease